MSVAEKQEIIIVRRQDPEEESMKGGAWKVAHADFMTAMMAFFLIMWLISQTDESTRASIANYFNPVQLAQSTTNRKGLEELQNVPPENPNETKSGLEKGSGDGTGGKAHQLQKPRFREGTLFQDPYAVLARIAAEIEANPQDTLGADTIPAESEVPGLMSGEASRDPFDPLYWQVAPVKELKAEVPPRPGTAPKPAKNTMDTWAPARKDAALPTSDAKDDRKPAAEDKSDPAARKADVSEADRKAAELKSEISKAVDFTRDSSASPVVEVRRTGAGTLISLTDDINFSMFAVGSAEPQAKVVKAMEKIARILQARPGKIVIRGHTDGRPFRSETYDNWRLSQARAQMALYMLVRGGFPDSRIASVEGHADRDPRNPADAYAAENRRIEILLQE